MKILESSDLGVAIRSRRKELHYTQAYISEFTGLSISFISDVENGKPTVELEKVIQLLQILGMDLFVERR
ncbi:MAG: helix-turn-helix domain-containing protein [Lachnospiraceae bacterium]|nr:helix-turn-helix domain-containing protein [Lachnospiraceae bacterium]MCD8119335.1 helix-turn-helix domain-containing protein [Lachnospiraceae bacterium]